MSGFVEDCCLSLAGMNVQILEAGGWRHSVEAWGFQTWKSSPGLSKHLSAPGVVAKHQPQLSLQELSLPMDLAREALS